MTLKAPQPTHLLASMGIASALLFAPGYAVSAPHHNHAHQDNHGFSVSAAKRASAQYATLELINEHRLWVQSRGNGKKLGVAKLIEKAQVRQQLLAELAETDPAEVLRIAIPNGIAQQLPAEVLEHIEQQVQVEGEVESLYFDDFEDPSNHRLQHVLKTNNGKRVKLHFAGKAPKLQSGNRINVEGLELATADDETGLVIGDDPDAVLMLAAGGGTDGGASGSIVAPLENTTGDQRTLVILANLQDNQVQPWTKAQVNSMVFGEVDQFIRENSSQQTWLSGDVYGWFTLPINGSNCNHSTISQAFRNAAQANGINLSAYERHVFVMPQHPTCTFGGIGSVGGNPSTALINGRMNRYTISHELGHNLGLYHANALECGSSANSGSCGHIEYGDTVDTMGNTESHFSAYNKEQLGWLNVAEVSVSGSYNLEPYAAANNGQPKALKVLKGIDPTWGTKNWYYLSYRKAVGIDQALTWYDNIQQGVVVQTGDEKRSSNASYLIDTTPNSAAANVDWWDPALTAGNSYTDSNAGVTISTDWVDSNGAQVSINLSGSSDTCTNVNPSLSVSPVQSQWVAAGTTVTYSVNITNMDSAACANRSFDLSAVKPAGWNASVSPARITLAPGNSGNTVLTVTSSGSATNGFYDIDITGQSGSNSASTTVTYVVDNPASNTAPVAQNDSASTAVNTPVTINVLGNDSDSDGDTLTITSVSGVNGTAQINSNSTITFTPASNYSGTESFNYSVSDGRGGSASASVAVSVAGSVNNAPNAINDNVTITSKTATTISVLANDSDADNDALTVVSVTQGSKGSVRVNSNGTVTYTPSRRFKSSDTFSYTVSDGSKSDTATVSIRLEQSSDDGSTDSGKGNGKKK